jgi:AraC-like DNA-binding protein
MSISLNGKPRGLLRRHGEAERFELQRFQSSGALREVADAYWDVRWDLTGLPAFDQEILPHPCIQLVVEAGHSGVFGVGVGKTTKTLSGVGRAFGIKFRPGMFHVLSPHPVARLTNGTVPLADILGADAASYEADILAMESAEQRVHRTEHLLTGRCGPPDADGLLAREIVDHIAARPDTMRVADVAASFDVSLRTLQRMFRRYVGVTVKWVIRRYRMHEAVERIQAGDACHLADLAAALGYCDQAHFAREFKQIVGRSPAQYMSDMDA